MTLELYELLECLKFRGMAQVLNTYLMQAQSEQLPIEAILKMLLTEEYRHRQEKALNYRIKQARPPWDWTLETFPFDLQEGVSEAQIRSLAGLDFLTRAYNIIFIGPPGTGNTGLAASITRKALLAGHRICQTEYSDWMA